MKSTSGEFKACRENVPNQTKSYTLSMSWPKDVVDKSEKWSYNDVLETLEIITARSLVKAMFIMMIFVRAEKESDRPLYLFAACCHTFLATSHFNYVRYGLYSMRAMVRLSVGFLNEFVNGEHVIRHKPGLWNGMWSVKTTSMRYIHAPKTIVGIALKRNDKLWLRISFAIQLPRKLFCGCHEETGNYIKQIQTI